ncbi:MAG: hypothetical protein AB7D96_10225 [Arcobacteraceae bacterium]
MDFKNIKNYISLTVLLSMTLISFTIYGSVSKLSSDDFIKSLSLAIFSTGFVLTIFEIIYKTRGEKYFEDLISEKIPMYLKMKDKGLEDISDAFSIKKYKEKITHSKELYIVMNDGKSFIGNHSYIFKERFQQKKETNIIILDPRSDVIPLLNKKNGKTDNNYYQHKLLDVIKEFLYDFEQSENHNLNIYVHDLFNTMSVVLFDDISMISLYRLSPGKSVVPHLEFHDKGKDSEYSLIYEDVIKLMQVSEKITKENYEDLKKEVHNKTLEEE